MAVMLLQPATAAGSQGVVPPTLLLVTVLGALAVLLVVCLLGSLRRVRTLPARLDACCDVAMGAAMAYMLVLML